MAKNDDGFSVVEVLRAFTPGRFEVLPGARLWAYRSPAGWVVVYNGADIPVPAGTVGELDSAEVRQARELRAAG